MSRRSGQVLLVIGLFGITFLLLVGGAAAQSTNHVNLSSPDISSFPYLTAYLDVHDPSGAFVHGLTIQEVSVLENEVSLPVNELVEKKPGVQFVMAISPGPSFGIRDGAGVSRYETLRQGFLARSWVSPSSSSDDFSLVTMGGPSLSHSSDPAALQSLLETYLPADSNAVPNPEVLAAALQVASDPTPHPGMGRAILFITSALSTESTLGLQSIISSASLENIHIFVWLLAAPETFELPEIDLLRNLASQTSAAYFAFAHDEPVPDLETYLEPLRYVYQLGYDSRVKASGIQQVAAQVTIGDETVTSPAQTFELNLRSPSVLILNLPNEIDRAYTHQPTPGSASIASDLLPLEEPVAIQVIFPDGYTRPLVRSSLYVDGKVVAEKTSPPFDQFIWDLRAHTQDGSHKLQVEVTDSLGWVGKSSVVSVKITIPSTTQEVVAVFSQKRPLVIGLAVLIIAIILLLVLIVGGRIRPKPYPGQVSPSISANLIRRTASYREHRIKLRSPLPGKAGSSSAQKIRLDLKRWLELLLWGGRTEQPLLAAAYLMPLVGSDEPTLVKPLSIAAEAVSIGNDAQKADLVIPDPSIEAVHAWIRRDGEGFVISDAGSVAGTWVNYQQVTPAGTSLVHADIIHLGRTGFRFTLAEPGPLRKVIVTPMEPQQ